VIRGTTTFSPGGRAVEKVARNAALLAVAAVACDAMAARLARGWATARKNMAVGGVGAFFGFVPFTLYYVCIIYFRPQERQRARAGPANYKTSFFLFTLERYLGIYHREFSQARSRSGRRFSPTEVEKSRGPRTLLAS